MAMAGIKHPFFHLILLLSVLAVSRSDDQNGAVPAAECVYSFYIQTGSLPAAGTNSKITTTFYDSAGNWIQIKNVETWGGKMGPGYDYFEQGQLDIFSGKGPCLPGPVCSLKLSSDGWGLLPFWNVQYLEITTTGYEKSCGKQLFSLNTWLIPPFGLTVTKDNCRRRGGAIAAAAEEGVGVSSSGFASGLASVVGHEIN